MARRWLNIHAAGRTAMHMMPAALVAVAADHFTGFDWAVVALYFAATTLVGARLAGRQATIRDFFLGGRKLPWYAVSGSIIATEISAVTFVGVPATVYFGDWRYLQLGLGAILARVIVGYWFVPAFYEREIYSPYDYMAHRLGPRVKLLTTGLFVVGQVLAQGVRVYLTALVLEVVTDGQLGLSASIWTLGVVAVGWTLLGGIATVIWTDVLLFLAFVAGGVIALGYVSHLLPGGFGELLRVGWGAGKFRVLDLSSDPTSDFTLWAGLIACTVFNLSMFGTDQLIAQRMFCCRDARAARRAMISSSVGLLVTVTMMLVGVGLFAFYSRHPLAPADAAAVAERSDRLFPIFIIRVLPVGLTGLVTTGIFAAAISSLDSILAALSQTTMSVTYQPLLRWRARRRGCPVPDANPRHEVLVSRGLVVLWGVALCGMAHLSNEASRFYPDILRLALSMAGYTGGALLAGFMLAFLRIPNDDRGLLWSAPISVLTVFAVAWHQPWARWVCWIGAGLVLMGWVACAVRAGSRGDGWRTIALAAALAGLMWISYYGYWPGEPGATGAAACRTVAWPWFVPIGFGVAFGFALVLGKRKRVSG